jgi:chemotaxis protein CheD
MKTGSDQIPLVHLRQSEVYITKRPAIVSTLLGSCISVVMFHRQSRVGGICHALLPRCPDRTGCGRSCPEIFRYVDCSIAWMLEAFSARLGYLSGLEVKLFGGGSLIEPEREDIYQVGVGNKNVQMAQNMFKKNRLNPVSMDVGGSVGRKILFHAHTGDVYVKRFAKKLFRQAAPRRRTGGKTLIIDYNKSQTMPTNGTFIKK